MQYYVHMNLKKKNIDLYIHEILANVIEQKYNQRTRVKESNLNYYLMINMY